MHPGGETRRRRQTERRDEERDADTEGVAEQEQPSTDGLAGASGDHERRAEQRPDARAPRRAERDAHDERPGRALELGQRGDQPAFAAQADRAAARAAPSRRE